jgi:hypothetical protein
MNRKGASLSWQFGMDDGTIKVIEVKQTGASSPEGEPFRSRGRPCKIPYPAPALSYTLG